MKLTCKVCGDDYLFPDEAEEHEHKDEYADLGPPLVELQLEEVDALPWLDSLCDLRVAFATSARRTWCDRITRSFVQEVE